MLTWCRLSPARSRSVGTWRVARGLAGRIWGRTLPVFRPPHLHTSTPPSVSRTPEMCFHQVSPLSVSPHSLSISLSSLPVSVSLSIFLSDAGPSRLVSFAFVVKSLSPIIFCCFALSFLPSDLWGFCSSVTIKASLSHALSVSLSLTRSLSVSHSFCGFSCAMVLQSVFQRGSHPTQSVWDSVRGYCGQYGTHCRGIVVSLGLIAGVLWSVWDSLQGYCGQSGAHCRGIVVSMGLSMQCGGIVVSMGLIAGVLWSVWGSLQGYCGQYGTHCRGIVVSLGLIAGVLWSVWDSVRGYCGQSGTQYGGIVVSL